MEKTKINYFDAHTHLCDYDENELKCILNNAKSVNIQFIVNNSCKKQDFEKIEIISKENNNIIPSFGFHPMFLQDFIEKDLEILEVFIIKNNKFCVGEIGLDYTTKNNIDKKIQKSVFEKQLDLAIKYKRPISIHCRRAHGDVLKILKKKSKQNNLEKNNIIMHSFYGTPEITNSFLKLNCNMYFSFSFGLFSDPIILKNIPIDKILIETDSPYQEYFENKNLNNKNEPCFLPNLTDFISKELQIEKFEISSKIFENSLNAFKISL